MTTVASGQRVEWTPIRAVDVQDYSGEVVSLGVDTHEHYIADGLVTHNCFYGWLVLERTGTSPIPMRAADAK